MITCGSPKDQNGSKYSISHWSEVPGGQRSPGHFLKYSTLVIMESNGMQLFVRYTKQPASVYGILGYTVYDSCYLCYCDIVSLNAQQRNS